MRMPKEIVEFVNQSAIQRLSTPLDKLLVLGVLAGVYIAMGALLSIVLGHGFGGVAAENPAIVRMVMGATFPIGLILIVLAGGELFTGCCAYFIPNAMNGRQRWGDIVKYCSIVWLANFVGALLFGYLLVYLAGVSSVPYIQDAFVDIAEYKCSNPFYVVLLRGVGANWLVCLAVWLGMASKSAGGKILGLWIPVMAFVAIGFEHSIANMFFIPVAIFEGADVSVVELFVNNLIPATIGNIIGGALFVGGLYGYLYDR